MAVRLVDLSRKGFHTRCAGSQFACGDMVTVRLPLDERTYLRLLARIHANTAGPRLTRWLTG